MSVLDNILKKIAGGVGKVASNVGTAIGAPRLGPSGSALGASLQNYGGQATTSPFVWVKPAYAAETGSSTPARNQLDYATKLPDNYLTGGAGGNAGGGAGGGSTGGNQGGSTGGAVMGAQTSDNGQGIAQDAYNSRLSGILNNLALMRDIAQRNIGQAQSVRDEVVGNIGTTYGNLRERAGQSKEAALENLAQEDIGVQNQYGRAGGTARRALESALTRNRMLARAMGSLNSSFYEDRQAQANESATRSISDIGSEEASKRAAIGTRTTESKNWYENKITDLGAEETQLTSQADREYQDQVNSASDMERAYGIDSVQAAEQAQGEYQSRLDQIKNYIQSKALRLAEISATAGKTSGILDAFSAVTPELSTTLASQPAITAGNNLVNTLKNQWGVNGQSGGDATGFATFKEDPLAAYYRQQKLLGNILY